MTKAVGRALATAALGALLGAAWLAIFYAWHPVLRVTFATDPPRLMSGVYPAEHDDRAQLTFAWTRDEAVLRLPGLDRRVGWTMHLRMRGGRPGANPTVQVLCDGLPIDTIQTGTEFQEARILLPPRPERRRGATIALRVSSTIIPGPSDPRPLGVQLDEVSLAPDRAVLAPREALAGAALSSAAMGAAIALLGVTAGSAIGAAIVVSMGTAAILARGFAPYTDFPLDAAWLAMWVGLALALGGWLATAGRGTHLRNTARFAAAFTAAAVFLRLLVLLHPDMPIGDAMFHAHRFEGVLRGNLLFTSIAPGGYSFPYPPGLYVFAAPFARLVQRGAADMALLRVVVVAVDAAAALLLYRVIVHAWNDRLAGAMAVALYTLAPLDFSVITTGNLTNAFAQSLAVGAFVLMVSRGVRREHCAATGLLAASLAAAYLSHTSTLAILFAATILVAVGFLLRGGPALRSPAVAILIATCAAAIASVAIYYAHFLETYRTEFARIGHETATAAATAGNRTIGDRTALVPYSLRLYFGLPLIALAAVGWWWQRRGAADRLSLTVAGWLAACALFLVLGVLTPVDMRYYLAAVPALAVLGARGAARAWQDGIRWRIVAGVLLAWCVGIGIRTWWEALA